MHVNRPNGSVAERFLGKKEVESSILSSGSTNEVCLFDHPVIAVSHIIHIILI